MYKMGNTLTILKSPVFESWGSTEIKVYRHKHTWTINHFSLCYRNCGHSIDSPKFCADTNKEVKWYLKMYPYGDEQANKDFISLYINLSSFNRNAVKANLSIGLLDSKGHQFNKQSFSCLLDEPDFVGIPRVIHRNLLFGERSDLLKNDTLVVFCNMEFSANCETTSGKFSPSHTSLANELRNLLESKACSDVTLLAGGKEFPAHKPILAARSPVFQAMFKHNLEESEKGLIRITDVDHQVLSEMLRYIYSEEVLNMNEMAPDLLAVAEKYAISGLKIECEKAMLNSLSLENVVEFFILANLYRTDQLKASATKYIYDNLEDVVGTPAWKLMVQMHPQLVKDLFLLP